MTPARPADRARIERTLRRYSQGVDQRDWALYRRAFAPGALIEVPGYLDTPLGPEEFAGHLAGAFDTTRLSGQHILANTLYDIRGDRARTVTEFLAVTTERQEPGPAGGAPIAVRRQISGGLYVDDLVRTDDEWLIAHRVLVRKNDEWAVLTYGDAELRAVATAARNTAVAGL